ncbi:MAG: hypothetical protein GY699_14520 [Desulfobacteraceae bacterium]|nr:hypothetical protein [Desulfobacteraceae bacterium]
MRKFFLLSFFSFPILMAVFLAHAVFLQGNTGLKMAKTQNGFLISGTTREINQVQKNDIIISLHGLSYHEFLGFVTTWPFAKNNFTVKERTDTSGTMTILRGLNKIELPINTIAFSPAALFKILWPQILLMAVFLSLGTTGLLRAPPSPQATLFFLMLCSLSTSLAMTIPSSTGLLSPFPHSIAFTIHAVANWISFGLWLHFALRFPASRDFIKHRPWIPFVIYFLPAVTTIGISLYAAGITFEFWGWVQKLRNFYLPFIIIGVFVKHVLDYKFSNTRQEKNQVKFPLIAYWLTFSPYLFLYLLPNLLIDPPLIPFRVAIFAFFILPVAYLAGILWYQALNIDKVASKTVAYFITIIALAILYSLFLAGLKKYFFGEQILSKELFLFFLIFVNLIFHPVVLSLDHLIKKRVFKYETISAKTMHKFSNIIAANLHLPDLVHTIINELPEAINIRSAAVMTFEKKRSRLFPKHLRFGSNPWIQSSLARMFRHKHIEYLAADHLPDYFSKHSTEYLSDHSSPPLNPDKNLEKEFKEIQNAGFCLVLPLKGPKSLLGLLLLGAKKSGAVFGKEDIHLLASFANQAAIALENAITHESLIKSKLQLEKMFDKKVQSEKMAAIGEMTSMLAHELKNPLGIIHSSAQYLLDGKQSKIVTREMLQYIINEVDHLNLSINSILKLARQKTPEFERVHLVKRIPQLLDQWQRSEDHNPEVKIDMDIAPSLPEIYADFRQLAQVMLNLIRNSEEMMNKEGQIMLKAWSDNDFIQIQVIDDGPGIPENILDKIFNNFYTTKKDGLGLGLAACRQIVHAHNGTISLTNSAGNGAIALIRLPVKPLTTIGKSHDNAAAETA